MVDNLIYQQTSELLEMLETEMGKADLLGTEVPSETAMNSSAPFACDAMPFEAWLQFIFLPRMRQLIVQKQALPTSIAIAPMAEEVFQQMSEVGAVIETLRRIDSLLSGQ